MPNDSRHITQAQHNIVFLESFYKSYNFNDWSVTVSFYIAVHIIEAIIFITKKLNIGDKSYSLKHSDQLLNLPEAAAGKVTNYHEARNLIVAQNFSAIAGWFKILYNESKTARYRNYSFENWKIDATILFSLKKIVKWYNKKYPIKVRVSI